jgi:hypothetical protein
VRWESLATLMGILAWPFTFLVVAILFRRELKRALERLAQVRYGEFEASFEKKLRRAEVDLRADAPALAPRPKAVPHAKVLKESDRGSVSARLTATEIEAFYRLAILDPTAAVRSAWQRLESVLRDLGRAIGLGDRALAIPWHELALMLHERGLLPAAVPAGLDQLHALLASADDVDGEGLLSVDQARRYLDLALPLVTELDAGRLNRLDASNVN